MTPIESTESRRATGCVGAGVDFSFRLAFRESWGLVNLLQVAGRASTPTPRFGTFAMTNPGGFRCIPGPRSRAVLWRTSSMNAQRTSGSPRPVTVPRRFWWELPTVCTPMEPMEDLSHENESDA